MLQIFREYIKFYWKAKRRHGVHSPFVYDFTDNCLAIKSPSFVNEAIKIYRKQQKENKQKTLPLNYYKLFYKISKYYQKRDVLLLQKNERIIENAIINGNSNVILSHYSTKQVSFTAQLIILEIDNKNNLTIFEDLLDNCDNECMIVLNHIRGSKYNLACWESIVINPKIHLTIDLFHLGIIMKRPHQQKEHFTIKL